MAPFAETALFRGVCQGVIGQDTLSAMIRKDEMQPSRRRRYHELYTNYHDSIGKLPYPAGMWFSSDTVPRCCCCDRPAATGPFACQTYLGSHTAPYCLDYTQVGTWIQNHYGHLSAVAAVIRLHAVVNQNYTVRTITQTQGLHADVPEPLTYRFPAVLPVSIPRTHARTYRRCCTTTCTTQTGRPIRPGYRRR